jgi:hypothetical protein
LQDREPNREEQIDRENRPDDADDDLLQQPHGPIVVNRRLRGTEI